MANSDKFIIFYEEEKNAAVLRILVPLEISLRQEFSELTEWLLDMPADFILLDLTNITRIFSLFTGTIVDFHKECEQQNKNLIVAVNPTIAKVFKSLSFDKVLNMRVKETTTKKINNPQMQLA